MTKQTGRRHIAQLGPAHPNQGGIVHFNNRLALALKARQDLEVHQYFWKKPYPECLLPGPASTWLDTRSRISFQVPGQPILNYANPWTWLDLAKRIHADGCRVLVTHWVHPVHFPVYLTLFTAIRCFTDIKIHLIVHNARPHETFLGAMPMTKTIMNLAHRVIVHSSSDFDMAVNKFKIKQKTRLSFHPVYDFFQVTENICKIRENLNLKRNVFLFFGFIRPYKGLDYLIQAFDIFCKSNHDTSLLIAGKSLHQNKYSSLCTESNSLLEKIKENKNIVQIDEYIPNEEVGNYFSIADALIAPYIQTSQSGPVHIASAFGKPVIASDLPSFRDCIEPGVTGCLFKPGDPHDLACAMEHALKHTWDPVRIQEHGKLFDWERYVHILLDDDNGS